MKRTISLLLVVLILISAFSTFTFSATTKAITKKNANFQYTINSNQITIDKYIGKSTNVNIPSKIDNKKVTTIGSKAFMGKNINAVKIPATVTFIARSAFDSCINLKNISIPSNVKKIGNASFFNCTRLTSVTIGNGVATIGKGAFYNCKALKSITIPSSVKSIGDYAFGNCSSLQVAKFSTGNQYVGSRMFMSCKKLTTVTLSDTIKSVGYKAFFNCEKLRKINIPGSITTINKSAFELCYKIPEIYINVAKVQSGIFRSTNLKTLTLGDKVTTLEKDSLSSLTVDTLYIGKNVKTIYGDSFDGASIENIVVDENNPYYVMKDNVLYSKDMKTLVKCFINEIPENATFDIPKTVTKIETMAFKGKTYSAFNLPEKLQYIGDYAFSDSDNFTKLSIPDTVTYIGEGAFSGCYSLSDIKLPNILKTIPNKAFVECENLKSINIPDTVEKIGAEAFSSSGISKIDLPSSLKSLSSNAFGFRNNLKYISVDKNNSNFTVVDNVLFSKDKSKLVLYPSNKSNSSYTIPTGTKEISSRAFSNNSYIKNITIPSSVTIIRGKGFITLSKVKLYKVPSSVKTFGKYSIGFNETAASKNPSLNFDVNIYGSATSNAHKYAVNSGVVYYTGTPKQNLKAKNVVGGKSFIFKINNTVPSDLVYTSSNQRVAKVDFNGKVTGLKKGTAIIIATNAYTNYECKVTVTSTMKKYKYTGFDESKYTVLNEKSIKSWQKKYYAKNKSIKMTPTDNPSINCYTSQEYIYMKAATGATRYLKEDYDDYSMYNYYNAGLKMELSRFKLSQNTVLYSGTPTVACITGKTNSIKDMKSSVGKTVTIKEMVSTSVDHGVANGFSGGQSGIVLEIYAPKTTTVGGYIEKMSEFSAERELLIAQGSRYKVLDAGVRKVKIKQFGSTETISGYERYMKLLLVK